MASIEQVKFHGAMMRHLRQCLRAGAIDDSAETTKALIYARKLTKDEVLRKNISAGLAADFSIETDMKYIRKALALVDPPGQANAGADEGSLLPEETECFGPEEQTDLDELQAQLSPEEWEEIMRAGTDQEVEELPTELTMPLTDKDVPF